MNHHTEDDGDTRDLDVLRDFRAELSEPSPARLAAIRAGAVMRPRRRALAPVLVGAAAALALVAGATAVALTNGTERDAGPAASSGPPQPSEVDQQGPGSKVPSVPDLVDPAGHAAAVDLLERLAIAAEAEGSAVPVTVPAGQLLYVSGTGDADGTAYRHELWLDPEGAIVLMIRRHDGGVQTVVSPDPGNPKDNMEQEIAEWRAQLAQQGPSLTQPTPAFLAGLPTDPQALLALLTAATVPAQGSWSVDHAIVGLLTDTLYRAEPLVPPTVRAALLRALALLPSVSSTGEVVEVNGRRLYAIDQAERGMVDRLYLDADTGRFAGQGVGGPGPSSFTSLWSFAVVPAVGATP